jgi:L-ascorbate metabolism protein UlaG (beta-lactamase superfamily)
MRGLSVGLSNLGLVVLLAATACDSESKSRSNAEDAAGTRKAPATVAAPAQPPIATSVSPMQTNTARPVSDTLDTSAGPVSVTPIVHGTLALGFKGKTWVVDPWSQAPEGSLPKADVVLLTHVHQDHFDPKGIAAVRRDDTVFVAPEVVAKQLGAAKVLANGKKLRLHGVEIEAVPMYNLERGPEPGKLFHDKGRGNGYLLGFGDKTVYVSGDTECTPEMKALKGVDLAFVCMNLPYTMPPGEAAECVKAFEPSVVIPYHYRGSNRLEFERALASVDGVEVRLRDFYPSGE